MPGKVLLADRSLSIQKSVTQLLKAAGIEVVSVGNGEHAVRKLPDVKPDLVLADVFMPVRTGYEVCEYIKNSEQFSHVPVLLLASSMEPFDEKEAKRVRADGRLNKPFTDTAVVMATIKQWLDKALQAKPPVAAPAIEEFAAAVPAAEPEPEPAPAYEDFSTRPPVVTFEKQEAPVGFADMLEEAPAAPAPPSEPPPAAAAAGFAGAAVAEAPAPEIAPAAMVPEAEPEPEAAQPQLTATIEWTTEPAPPEASGPPPIQLPPPVEPAPAKSEYKVEKPELASPWEMTGPPPGAPEIPSGPSWDSQWKGVPDPEATAAAEAAVAPPPEAPPADRFEPSEFAAALAAAEPLMAAAPVPQSGIDPAVVEAVVREVMERLSPQVLEQISREIVRPLAETLLKQKLQQ